MPQQTGNTKAWGRGKKGKHHPSTEFFGRFNSFAFE